MPLLKTRRTIILCSEASLVNPGQSAFRAVTLKCRSWSCDLCRSSRKAELVQTIQAGKPDTFITLTVNPAWGRSPVERARGLVDSWREVVKRAIKKYKYKNIPYICVFEATKKGEPHLHILCRCKWIDQAWLSRQMVELMWAHRVDIRRVKSTRHCAYYLAKYMGKDPERFATCKRYWKTRNYREALPVEEPEASIWANYWYTSDKRLPELARLWRGLGFEVEQTARMVQAFIERPPERLGSAP